MTVVGGLDVVSQYRTLEKPFWEEEIPRRSQGRIRPTIRSLDSGGLRATEMLQLMRLGVVPFGTAIVAVVAGDEPELNAVDLPAFNPDMATLRRTVGALRGYLADILRERYDIELLGVYTYPAQVLFCTGAFDGLAGIAGRKVRTSSVGQSELIGALGAIPVIVPFGEVVTALRNGVADCAITGTLSGFEIGLPSVTTHVHAMALSWGVSVFGANRSYWMSLPPGIRGILAAGIADLEGRIWSEAEADTVRGLLCNTGAQDCGRPLARAMILVPTSPAEEALRRRLLAQTVLPRWIDRCGAECARVWSDHLEPLQGRFVGPQ